MTEKWNPKKRKTILYFETAIEFMIFLKEVEFTYGGKIYNLSEYIDDIIKLLELKNKGI